MKACWALVVGILSLTLALHARASCSPTVKKIDCSDAAERAQHHELCELQLKGVQAAAELLSQPESKDPERACARSWALRHVYQLAEPHEENCEQYLCPFGVENTALKPDSKPQVTVTIAFDIERVSLMEDDQVILVYVRPKQAGPVARNIVLSLEEGTHRVQFRTPIGIDEKDIPVDAKQVSVELGVRVAVGAQVGGKPISIGGNTLDGDSILISGTRDVPVDDGSPDCHVHIDAAQRKLVFSAGCNEEPPESPTVGLGPQARLDRTFTGSGGMWLLGGLVGIPAGRFTFEPRAGALLSTNTKGGSVGFGLGYRVWGPLEALLGADLLAAHLDGAPNDITWGVYPGLQLRYRPSPSGFGVLASGNLVCLFDERLERQAKTVYPSIGLGAEWRFGL